GWEAEYLAEARAAIVGAATEPELEEARVAFLGRRSRLTEALRSAKDLSVEERAELNRTKASLEGLVEPARQELRASELDRSLAEELIDVTLPGRLVPRGHYHLLTQIRREIEDVFLGLGYGIVDGDEVEDSWHLFDALNMGPAHVTRSPLHTLYLNGDVVLRTETSPSQIRVMESQPPPVYIVSLGRVYRRDTTDATHSPIFHQVEGLAVDHGITLADLKGTLRYLARALFGEDREVRFQTD